VYWKCGFSHRITHSGRWKKKEGASKESTRRKELINLKVNKEMGKSGIGGPIESGGSRGWVY